MPRDARPTVTPRAPKGLARSIAGSTREQSNASQTISHSVGRIAELSHDNQQASQTSRQSADHLNQLAGTLNGMVTRFRLD